MIYFAFAIVRGVIESITFTAIRNFILFNQPFIIAGQMWFLFALLYDYILYAVLDCLNPNKLAYACIPVLAILYILLAQVAHLAGVTVPNMIYRNFLIEGFCFFMLGNWICYKQDKTRISNRTLVIVIVFSTLLCFVERFFMGRDFGVNIVTFPQVTAIFLYGVNNPKKFCGNALQITGTKLSMLIYILHPAVWHIIEAVYGRCSLENNITALYLMPLLVLGFTIICGIMYAKILELINKRIEERC